jgi:hypothetical protein
MTHLDGGLFISGNFLFGFLLTVLLLFLAVAGVVAVWTVIRIYRHRRRVEALRRAWVAERTDAAGRPLPPFARGLCDSCHQAFEKVYYLPSGRRACPACYAALAAAPGDPLDAAHRTE